MTKSRLQSIRDAFRYHADDLEVGYYEVDVEDMRFLLLAIAESEKALQHIADWADAYPLSVFPEPDFKRAAKVLKDAGMTIDAISASNMRHVLNGIIEIVKAALAKMDVDDEQSHSQSEH